jgi:hypothetical protein
MTQNTETQKEVAIKKVVVQLGKKELILNIEDAKQLREVLNELCGEVVVEKSVEHHHTIIEKHVQLAPSPFYYWNYPAITYSVGTSNALPGLICNSGTSFQLDSGAGIVNCVANSNAAAIGRLPDTGSQTEAF